MKHKITLGIFTYNEEKHLSQAISSLLQQTYQDFSLVILDDCSTDRTVEIIRSFAEKDKRISFYQNTENQGYAINYIKTFELAHHDTEYFAWAAGHDWHHPEWLAAMVQALDETPEAFMAFPLTCRIGDQGEVLDVPSPVLDTVNLNPRQRIDRMLRLERGTGDMIYGLFRADALRRAGVFRRNYTPDTLLLWEMSLYGSVRQINRELWYRRYAGTASLKRQKKGVFGKKPPWHAHLGPLYFFMNTWVLFRNTVCSQRAGSIRQRWWGLYASWMYLKRSLGVFIKNSFIWMRRKQSATS